MLPPDRADAGLCVCASSRPPEDAHTRLSGDALRPHAMWLPTAWPSLPYSSAARPPSPPRWRAKARPRPPSPATARQPLPAGHLSPLLPSGSDPPNPPLPGPVPAVRPSARASRSSTAGLPPFFSRRASPLQPPSSASLAASLAATRARANRTPRSASSVAPRHGRLPSSGDASFDLLLSPTSNPPGRPDAGPCLAGPTPSPYPLFVASIGFVVVATFPTGFTTAATFPAGSVVSLDESSSSWLDLSLSWPPDRIRRCLFSSASSTATLTSVVACAAAGLPSGAPQRPDDRRSEKVIGLPLLFFCCAAPLDVDARTSTPLEEQGSTPPRLRLPRHPGAIIYMEYAPVSTLAAKLVPSRRCDCRGFQPAGSYLRLLLQSHRLWCSRCGCGGC
jgi:hypothetical protein